MANSFELFSSYPTGRGLNEKPSILAREELLELVLDITTTPVDLVEEAVRLCAPALLEMIDLGVLDRGDVVDAVSAACADAGYVENHGWDALQKLLGQHFGTWLPRSREEGSASSATSAEGGTVNCIDALPLVRLIPKAEPFPIDALGVPLRAAASAIQAATQAPIDICGNAVLAGAALAAQAHADVVMPTGEAKPISLFMLTVARSGERKTSVDQRSLVPVKEHQAALRSLYENEIEIYVNGRDAFEAQRKKILGDKKLTYESRKAELDRLGSGPKPPLTPVLMCPEPTIEGLVKLLIDGQPSVGVFTSEGGAFIGGHGFTEEAKLRTAASLSMLWDDGGLTRVRATDGVAVLSGRRVSMHLQAQPDVASRLLSDRTLRDQGLLSRILVAAPDTSQGRRFWKELGAGHNSAMDGYCASMLSLLKRRMPLKDNSRNELAPRRLHLVPEARQTWIAFADEVERELSPDGQFPEIGGFAAKLPEHALRLAGVLTLFEDPDALAIPASALNNGIELARYYAKTALRLHGASQVNAVLLEAEVLLRWLQDKWYPGHGATVSLPDVVKDGPNSIRDTGKARQLLKILEDHRQLVRQPGPQEVKGKTRREVWQIQERKFSPGPAEIAKDAALEFGPSSFRNFRSDVVE